jgi:hypothetical protein
MKPETVIETPLAVASSGKKGARILMAQKLVKSTRQREIRTSFCRVVNLGTLLR